MALFDAVTHYHSRTVELHLRQSKDGIWTEAFSAKGDLDYGRLFRFLERKGVKPHFVLEQAVETGSPKQLSAGEGHRRGRINLERSLSGTRRRSA